MKQAAGIGIIAFALLGVATVQAQADGTGNLLESFGVPAAFSAVLALLSWTIKKIVADQASERAEHAKERAGFFAFLNQHALDEMELMTQLRDANLQMTATLTTLSARIGILEDKKWDGRERRKKVSRREE